MEMAPDQGNWEQGIRLCRFVKDPPLWACLAAMAINGRELNAAEVIACSTQPALCSWALHAAC
jgi:hypothetical protein